MTLFKTLKRPALALAFAGAVAAPLAAQDNLSMASLAPASSATTFSIAFSEVVQKNSDLQIQLATGQTATRMVVDAGRGELDLYLYSAPIVHWMRNNQVMYKDMAEAPELAKNLRTIVAYPLGAYQFIVWADSGIESFDDLKGRNVYVGPPAGAGTSVANQFIEAASGLKVDEDYTAAKLDWASGMQAFQDRQVDLYVSPESIPSGGIAQLAALGEIRILGVDEATINTPAFEALRKIPGRRLATVPSDAYGERQVNDTDVMTLGTWVGVGTHAGVNEESVYKLTKALWENLEDLHGAAKWLSVVNKENAFVELNAPLHLGAYRYYKEAGFDVPDGIVPEGM